MNSNNNNNNNNNSKETSIQQQVTNNDIINKEMLTEILQRNETNPSEIEEFTYKNALGKGENYLSVIYRVNIILKDKSERHLIIKTMPETLREFLKLTETFDREINMYDKWLPRLVQICERKLKTGGTITPFWPKYYKSVNRELLVLEDLSKKDFKNGNRHTQFNFEYSGFVLRYLARLHAYSIALINEFPNLSDLVGEGFYKITSEEREKINKMQYYQLADIVGKWEGYERFKPILENLYNGQFDRAKNAISGSKCNVLNHGDCWVNNILFQFDNDNNPHDLRFVDFQISRVGSPVLDLLYFFHSSIQHEVWVNNLDKLLEIYYESFQETLQLLEIPISITIQDLYDEMESKWFFGFIAASFVISAVVADPSEAIDFEKMSPEGNDNAFGKAFKGKRFGEIFRKKLIYFEEKGYFKDFI